MVLSARLRAAEAALATCLKIIVFQGRGVLQLARMKRLLLPLLFAACTSEGPPPAAQKPLVTATTVQIASVPITLEYVGHVEAYQFVEVRAQVAGLLVDQHFIEGDFVGVGNALLSIDSRPFEAELARAEALLARSYAALKQARDTEARNALLVPDNYISQLEYDRIVTNLLEAEAAVKENAATVDLAKINLGYCSIVSPIPGVTSKLAVDVGNYVAIGGDEPLLSINQVQPIKLDFYIPEKDLPEIARCHHLTPLKLCAIVGDEETWGTLTLINNKVDEKTGTILLEGTFDNPDLLLWPGQFVSVKVILREEPHALVLPERAVQIGQSGPYVYVLDDHHVALRPVETGERSGNTIVIRHGLSEGEAVVLDGQINLRPGIEVERR
jgi:multidrug efflux system membrane fusion protein